MGLLFKDKSKSAGALQEIPIVQIQKNRNQPRTVFSQEELQSLSQSIQENGLLQPITVRKIEGGYELISGERRLIASQMAGMTHIRALVLQVSDEQSAIFAILENIQRQDLNCFEEAIAMQTLMQQYHLTQEQLALKLGHAQSTIANKLRLLRLPLAAQRRIIEGGLTERHARALLKVTEEDTLFSLIDRAIAENWNVSQTEQAMRQLFQPEKPVLRKPKRVLILKDIRPFVNSLNKVVHFMKNAGIEASAVVRDDTSCYEYVVRIPKPSRERRKNLA